MPRGLFITGTDTNVGKTYVGSLIVRTLREQGVRVGVYKPVASGCAVIAEGTRAPPDSQLRSGELLASDAFALWEAAGRPGKLRDVCPQAFAAPLAPPLAAREEGKTVDAALLRAGLAPRQTCDVLIVEGAGGFFSPLSDADLNADLAIDLGFPLVIVVRNALGCINQALMALHAAATYRGGMPVAAVVLCDVSPPDDDVSRETNLDAVRSRTAAPVVVRAGWNSAFAQPVDWLRLASTG